VNLTVPCLHRVHFGEPQGAQAIHSSLGMSIEYRSLVGRLEQLDRLTQRNRQPLRSQLVTFDDGWADVMRLAPHFAGWPHLQPVLFLTTAQLAGERALLPLPRLYEWCASSETSVDALAIHKLDREYLKLLPEEAQHLALDRVGIPRIAHCPEILTDDEVQGLLAQGWLVGSHGPEHSDLRHADHEQLERALDKALKAVRQADGVAWLAWPEGRCCPRTCELAASVGFQLQFSLAVESGSINRPDLIHREIWK
jgi:hypothetical protein